MELAGTVIGGVIRLDGNATLPEGSRVQVQLQRESDADFLAGLRESIEDVRAGRTRPAREVMNELALEHGLNRIAE